MLFCLFSYLLLLNSLLVFLAMTKVCLNARELEFVLHSIYGLGEVGRETAGFASKRK